MRLPLPRRLSKRRDVLTSDSRCFSRPADNLVGLALQPPLSDYDFASAWLAFETSTAREHAKHSMYGLQYPGTYKKLWMENAEDRARKTGECTSRCEKDAVRVR